MAVDIARKRWYDSRCRPPWLEPYQMDLDLDSLIGRKTTPVMAEVIRPLAEADLALLATERGIQPSAIKRLTDNHHALARYLARGTPDIEAALYTGYTPSRISVLKDSPLFAELVAHYRSIETEVHADAQELQNTAHLMLTKEVIRRMEEEPEKVGNSTLGDWYAKFADRTGHGPQSKTTNVNVNLSYAERVRAARTRSMSAKATPHVPLPLGADQGLVEVLPPDPPTSSGDE